MNYILFDLEFTTWNYKEENRKSETIEIGAIKIGYDTYLKRPIILGKFHSYVKPILRPRLCKFCKRMLNIRQETIDQARTFDIVIKDFLKWANKENEEYYLISWGRDDRKQLFKDCHIHNLDYRWIKNCINLQARYKRMLEVKKSGLKNTLVREEIPFKNLKHRALYDTLYMAKIFLKYFYDWDIGKAFISKFKILGILNILDTKYKTDDYRLAVNDLREKILTNT